VTVEEVHKVFEKAVKTPRFKNIVSINKEPLVSSDFIGDPHSAIVDFGLTRVIDGDLVKIIAWYDNEWGYANRLFELAISL
jgi:glyceraldehyde 3-phosphate dehydrogenase